MKDFFSSNLKYLRTQKNLSQNRLAQMIGVNASTVKRWEEESMSPGIDKVEAISKIFCIPFTKFLEEDLRNYKIEEISTNEFEKLAKDWVKSNNMTPEEKQKFLRELSYLVDKENE